MKAIGIDIGGTAVKAGVVYESGALAAHASAPTPEGGEPAALMEAIAKLLAPMLGPNLAGIGISVAGFAEAGGEAMSHNPNLPALAMFPLRKTVAERFGLPALLEVDSNASAIAEWRFGAGRGAKRLLFLTLGTGVGGGVILEGELMRFTGRCAGDLGHVIVSPGGRRCSCGALGCLEAEIGRAGLEEASGQPMRALIAAARAGESAAKAVFEAAGRLLGLGLASLAHIFQPDRIVIGGGIATVGEPLLGAARTSFSENASPHFSKGVEIVLAHFRGHEGVIGAAALFL